MKKRIQNNVKFAFLCMVSVLFFLPNAEAIEVEKKLLYDKYTLNDSYPYKNSTRQFQWDKINKYLSQIESIQTAPATWGILQNYKNLNGEAPLVKNYHRNEYDRIADNFDIERYQAVPLYSVDNLENPVRYGQDGDLIKIIEENDDFIKAESVYFGGVWMIPKKYVHTINSHNAFTKTIFVDRTNQNIALIETVDDKWLIRSINPVTTGLHKPPYEMSTPVGIFVIQEKKSKMFYYKDGTTQIAGYAPHASRFSTGAYLHGVPLNGVHAKEIEYSNTLGTTPRSHKCVRNATSHAKFIYDWAPVDETLVIVFD